MCPASSHVPSSSHPLTASWIVTAAGMELQRGALLGSPGSSCRGEESPKAGPAAEPKQLTTQITFLWRNTSQVGQRPGSCFQSAKTDCVTKGNSSVSHPIALCICITGHWSRASTSTGRLSLGRCKGILPSIYFFKHRYNTSSLILSRL